MKKYTIVTSDIEEDKSDKDMNNANKSSCNGNNPCTSTITPVRTVLQSEEGKLNNSCLESQPSSQVVKNKEVESLSWEHTRTPSIKSDEEISYWITTAKAPCLYHYDSDITTSFVSPTGSFVGDLDNYHSAKENDKTSPNKSSYILDGKSYDLPTYIPSNKSSANNTPEDIQVNNGIKSALNLSSVSPDVLAEVYKEYRDSSYSLKRSGDDNSYGYVKHKVSKNTQPLDDYDSGSSVLTINYIKYVNNKQANNMKQSRLKRKHLVTGAINSSSDSAYHSGCTLQDKERNLRPLRERVITKCNKSYNMNISYEDTKKINQEILHNTKTSSSSHENCFNNEPFFKRSSKVSSQSIENPNSTKLFNDDHCSERALSTSNISSNNMSKSFNKVSQMIYTKVETIQYISDCYPTDLSNNKQTHDSYQVLPNVSDFLTQRNLKTEDIYKVTQTDFR